MNVKIIAMVMMVVCVAPCFGMQKLKKVFLGDQLEKSINSGNISKIEKALKETDILSTNSSGQTYAALAILKDEIEVKNAVWVKFPRNISEEQVKNQIFQCMKACPTSASSPFKPFDAELKVVNKLASLNPEAAQQLAGQLARLIRDSEYIHTVNYDYQELIKEALDASAPY